MKATDPLSISQLAQRLDELEDIATELDIANAVQTRIQTLSKAIDKKMQENNFNRGIITPLPPDHVDNDNPFVVTPKAPSQVERETVEWERKLNR